MNRLIAIVLTHNEAEQIAACIETLRFADCILVFDSFSSDDTVAIARRHGAEATRHAFENYAEQRNAALRYVAGKTTWVLFVDADERIGEELAAEVRAKIQRGDVNAWKIPRHNFIFGVLTKGGGWYPDYQTRLLRVGKASYDSERHVHEVVVCRGAPGVMSHPIVHYNYRDAAHFREKQERYLRYDARMLFEQGLKPTGRSYVAQPLRHFCWRFVRLKGYRDSWHGLKLCLLMAWYEYRKYRLLAKMRSSQSR